MSKKGKNILLMAFAVVSSCPSGNASSADLTAAKAQFQSSCGTCHAAEEGAPSRQGPNLFDRFGKVAGTLEGFNYSEALKTSTFVWDEVTLDRWITDTQAMRPGVLMTYRQADPVKRRLIIDYLKSLSGSPVH
jgi:cytochrome c